MKGYPTTSGYKGYVNGEYMLFETEEAYYEYCQEQEQKGEEL